MEWSEQNDIALMKEVRLQSKEENEQPRQIWVQNRYLLLAEKYRVRMKREVKASGTSPYFSELDQLTNITI